MDKPKNVRLSLEISKEDHKYLKMCCSKLGISIRSFVLSSVIKSVEEKEDEWTLSKDIEAVEEYLKNPDDKVPAEEVWKQCGLA